MRHVDSRIYVMYDLRVSVPVPIAWLTPTADPERAPDIEIGRLDTDVQASLEQVSWAATEMPRPPEPWLLKSTCRTSEGVFTELCLQSPTPEISIRFIIGPDGRHVWCGWPPEARWSDVAGVMVKAVMGRVLRLQGRLALHASAVSVGGKALLLLGRQGAGKSTTAAGFHQLGYRVLADDVAAVSETDHGYLVHPACPELRLRADAAAVYSEPHLRAPLWMNPPPWIDKTRLLLPDDAFESQPRPLAAIVVLQPSAGARPTLTRLTAPQALLNLTQYVYGGDILQASGRRHEFGMLGRLAASVPYLQLQRPDNLSCIPVTVGVLTDYVSSSGEPDRSKT
jgi:hypothetical protein